MTQNTNQIPQQPQAQPEVQPQQPQQPQAQAQQPVGHIPPHYAHGVQGAPVPPPANPGHPVPGMPIVQLTGGMKAAWFFVGFLLGPVGILLAWLINLNNFPEAKSGAMKFSIIGCVVTVAAVILWIAFVSMATFALMGAWY